MVISISDKEAPKEIARKIVSCRQIVWPKDNDTELPYAFGDAYIMLLAKELMTELNGRVKSSEHEEDLKGRHIVIKPSMVTDELKEKLKEVKDE